MNCAHFAFQITEEDVESVLHDYSLRISNSRGASFAAMAAELLPDLDHARIERAALEGGCDLDAQTRSALGAIHQQLVEAGVIEF